MRTSKQIDKLLDAAKTGDLIKQFGKIADDTANKLESRAKELSGSLANYILGLDIVIRKLSVERKKQKELLNEHVAKILIDDKES